jgi:hypothetical protein
MNKRVTPKGTSQPDELPSLKERNPLAYWVAVITALGLFVGTFAGGLLIILS